MIRRRKTAFDFELNLTPIIDCFVTLICFVLLSSMYINLATLDAKVPLQSKNQTPTTGFQLQLTVDNNNFILQAKNAGSHSGKFKLAREIPVLHQKLLEIKKSFQQENTITFVAQSPIKYSELIEIMEATQNLNPSEIKDEKFLFQNFIYSNQNFKKL